MESLASIADPLLSLLTRWPIRTRLELPDRHHPRIERAAGERTSRRRVLSGNTASLHSVLKQLDKALVNVR
jgi:hypothetical protein